jgi:hypothetical protein
MVLRYFIQIFSIIKLSFLFHRQGNFESDINKEVILLNSIRVTPRTLLFERVLGLLLARRGCTVYQLLDDGALEHWDSLQSVDKAKYLNPLKAPFRIKIKSLLLCKFILFSVNRKGLHTVYIGDLLKSRDVSLIKHKNSQFKEAVDRHIYSSYRRYSTSSEYLNNILVQDYYQKTIMNAKIMASIIPVIESSIKPNRIISSHGIYTSWGIVHEYFKKSGIPTIVLTKSWFRKNSMWVTTEALQKAYKEYPNFQKRQSTKEIVCKKKINLFFEERFKHSSHDTAKYFGYSPTKEINIKRVQSNSIVFGMFPNVVWDGAIKERNIIFDDIISWIVQTVLFFSTSVDSLVVRFHPSETTILAGSASFEDSVREIIPDIDLYKNITLISAHDNVNSYALIGEVIDIVLDYDTTIALEATYIGKPVITAAKSRYSEAHFAWTPDCKEEYFDLLNNSKKVLECFKVNQIFYLDNLYYYTFWYIDTLIEDFPISCVLDFEYCTKAIQKDAFSEEKNKGLKHTLDKILGVSK